MSQELLTAAQSKPQKVSDILARIKEGKHQVDWSIQDAMTQDNLLHIAIRKNLNNLVKAVVINNPAVLYQENLSEHRPLDSILERKPIDWFIIKQVLEHLTSDQLRINFINRYNLLHLALSTRDEVHFEYLLNFIKDPKQKASILQHKAPSSSHSKEEMVIVHAAGKIAEKDPKAWPFVIDILKATPRVLLQDQAYQMSLGLALLYAVRANRLMEAYYLLRAGASLDVFLTLDETSQRAYRGLLDSAVQIKNSAMLALLIKRGADINASHYYIHNSPPNSSTHISAIQLAIDGWSDEQGQAEGPVWELLRVFIQSLSNDHERSLVINRYRLLHLALEHDALEDFNFLLNSIKSSEAKAAILRHEAHLTQYSSEEAAPIVQAAAKIGIEDARAWPFVLAALEATPKNPSLIDNRYKRSLGFALLFAVKANRYSEAKRLTAANASVTNIFTGINSTTPESGLLDSAVLRKNSVMLTLLIKHGADVLAKHYRYATKNENTPWAHKTALQLAIDGWCDQEGEHKGPHWNLIKAMIDALPNEAACVAAINSHHLLHLAIKEKNNNAYLFLLGKVKNPAYRFLIFAHKDRPKDSRDYNVLQWAQVISSSLYEDLKRRSPKLKEVKSCAIVHARDGDWSSVETLLTSGSLPLDDIYAFVNHNFLLHKAIAQGNAHITGLLLKYQAGINLRSKHHNLKTPLQLAIALIRQANATSKQRFNDCLTAIISHMVDTPYVKDLLGADQALLLAVEENFHDIQAFLDISKPAEHFLTSTYHQPPSHTREYDLLAWAVHHNDLGKISHLIKTDVPIGNALYYAIVDNKPACVQAILDAISQHPNRSVLLANHVTHAHALHTAVAYNHLEVIRVFLQSNYSSYNARQNLQGRTLEDVFYDAIPTSNYADTQNIADLLNIPCSEETYHLLHDFNRQFKRNFLAPIDSARILALDVLRKQTMQFAAEERAGFSPDNYQLKAKFDGLLMLDSLAEELSKLPQLYTGNNLRRKLKIKEIEELVRNAYLTLKDYLKNPQKPNLKTITENLYTHVQKIRNDIDTAAPVSVKRAPTGSFFASRGFGSQLVRLIDNALSNFVHTYPEAITYNKQLSSPYTKSMSG